MDFICDLKSLKIMINKNLLTLIVRGDTEIIFLGIQENSRKEWHHFGN